MCIPNLCSLCRIFSGKVVNMAMRPINIRTFSGPSVYHNKPLVRMRLDIGPLEQTDSSHLPDFVGRLLNVLPGLREHRCSKGVRGALSSDSGPAHGWAISWNTWRSN
jgi:Cyanophycin synthase-like N-terminal domain